MIASLLCRPQCMLGEGPLWHAERKSCFWVDIEGCSLYEYKWSDQIMKSWRLPHRITLAVQDEKENLILGMQGGIARFNLQTGELDWLLDIDKEIADNRCNDGGCDSEGRLWVGTMDIHFKEGAGSLYCIDKNLSLQKKWPQVTISNGLAWPTGNKKLYYIDSPTQTVQSFIFDASSGDIDFEKIVISIPANMGSPDGMVIDEEGMLWIAHWNGFGVYRWNPENGKLIETIQVPVPQVSCCAFFGEHLDHLIITTARQNMTEADLEKYPESGNVFIAKPGVKGIAKYKCSL